MNFLTILLAAGIATTSIHAQTSYSNKDLPDLRFIEGANITMVSETPMTNEEIISQKESDEILKSLKEIEEVKKNPGITIQCTSGCDQDHAESIYSPARIISYNEIFGKDGNIIFRTNNNPFIVLKNAIFSEKAERKFIDILNNSNQKKQSQVLAMLREKNTLSEELKAAVISLFERNDPKDSSVYNTGVSLNSSKILIKHGILDYDKANKIASLVKSKEIYKKHPAYKFIQDIAKYNSKLIDRSYTQFLDKEKIKLSKQLEKSKQEYENALKVVNGDEEKVSRRISSKLRGNETQLARVNETLSYLQD